MDDLDTSLFKAISKTVPRKFWELRSCVAVLSYRDLDHALQRLRKAGKIKYLKKADGGPGWVRI